MSSTVPLPSSQIFQPLPLSSTCVFLMDYGPFNSLNDTFSLTCAFAAHTSVQVYTISPPLPSFPGRLYYHMLITLFLSGLMCVAGLIFYNTYGRVDGSNTSLQTRQSFVPCLISWCNPTSFGQWTRARCGESGNWRGCGLMNKYSICCCCSSRLLI